MAAGDVCRRLLVVTGSRSLSSKPRGKQLALDALKGALEWLEEADEKLVMHGDAKGPDSWIDEVAIMKRWGRIAVLPDGRLKTNGSPSGEWASALAQSKLGKAAPLARNVEIIRRALAYEDEGWEVSVTGLVDPASPTRGTDHTLAQARDAGLWHERILVK